MGSEYDVYAVCKCGWFQVCPFGDLFHLNVEVCPSCGRRKSSMDVVNGRVQTVNRSWRNLWVGDAVLVPRKTSQ